MLNITKLSIAGLALMSASAFASTSPTITVGFDNIYDSSGDEIFDKIEQATTETYQTRRGRTKTRTVTTEIDNIFNEFYVAAGDVSIKVSGWSDTGDAYNDSSYGDDDLIEKSYDFDKNGSGWSMENNDEISNLDSDDWDAYSHSADNKGGTSQDYDMYLLEFSDDVNISQATSSWLYNVSNTQLTIAALTSNDIAGKTWTQVEENLTKKSGYSDMQTDSGYYSDFGIGTSSSVADIYSKFWLIGALNSVFGGEQSDEGNDGIKLSGISFTKDPGPGTPPPGTSVPEPTSIAIFGLALLGFAARRKAK